MTRTLKKFVSSVLAMAVLGISLVAVGGCEKDEIHTTRSVEIKEAVVSQDTVVE